MITTITMARPDGGTTPQMSPLTSTMAQVMATGLDILGYGEVMVDLVSAGLALVDLATEVTDMEAMDIQILGYGAVTAMVLALVDLDLAVTTAHSVTILHIIIMVAVIMAMAVMPILPEDGAITMEIPLQEHPLGTDLAYGHR